MSMISSWQRPPNANFPPLVYHSLVTQAEPGTFRFSWSAGSGSAGAERFRPAEPLDRRRLAAVRADDGPAARLRAMVTALAEYLTRHPGTCAGLLGALGAAGRLDEVLQASDTWIAAPLREVLTRDCDAGQFAAGTPRIRHSRNCAGCSSARRSLP